MEAQWGRNHGAPSFSVKKTVNDNHSDVVFSKKSEIWLQWLIISGVLCRFWDEILLDPVNLA